MIALITKKQFKQWKEGKGRYQPWEVAWFCMARGCHDWETYCEISKFIAICNPNTVFVKESAIVVHVKET